MITNCEICKKNPKIEEEELNNIKNSLYFWFKNKDRSIFFENLERIKSNVVHMTEFQLIDFWYTLLELNISSIWLEFLDLIFIRLSKFYRIDLLKTASFYNLNDNSILKKMYQYLICNSKTEDEIQEIIFLNKKLFKPIRNTFHKTIKRMDEDLRQYILDLGLHQIITPEKKIFCYERIVQFRKLTNKEIKELYSYIKSNICLGKIIDIFLKSGELELISNAYNIIKKEDSNLDNIFKSEHTVHYFEINDEIIQEIQKCEIDFFDCLNELINISRLITCNNEINHILNILISSGYQYTNNNDTVSLEKCFSYCWSICDYDGKVILINDFIGYDIDICCYGFLINMLCLTSSMVCKTFLTHNVVLDKEKDKMEKLKYLFPIDHEIWENPELIEKELTKL
jgi:hypothetical protein